MIRDAFNLIDYSNSDDADNLPMQHNPKTIERFQYIQEGKNIQECIESLPKHLQISQFYSRGNTMRLKMDALSPTLVPGHSNFPLHPTEHRSSNHYRLSYFLQIFWLTHQALRTSGQCCAYRSI
ncbi:hypothetical protein MMM7_01940 [Helicobacter pylori]